jgi:putative ABC transport system substrate-binding protein
VAVIWQGSVPGWQAADTAARARGWKLLSLEVRGPDDIDAAFKAAADALRTPDDVLVRAPLRARQAGHRRARSLPAIYELRRFVEVSGLMFYGVDDNNIWRHAAAYVGKILKGAGRRSSGRAATSSVGDQHEAAKALGLAIPQHVLLRADELIE